MTEKPILFSAPMVKAILAGTKTVTRRVMKPQPTLLPDDQPRLSPWDDSGFHWASTKAQSMVSLREAHCFCPYGLKGDILWVRETWRTFERPDGSDGIRFRADDAFVAIDNTLAAADLWIDAHDNGKHVNDWRPSIFMRPWMSRIKLEVTGIAVARLQEITEEQAKAEGVTPLTSIGADQPLAGEDRGRTQGSHPYTLAFAVLWDTINSDRAGCAWKDNPWLWAVSFRRAS